MENQSQHQVQDKNIRIDEQELNYWFKEFGISKEEILDEVKKGSSTATEAVENIVKRTALVA